jgi:hypothetical protein
MNEPYINQSSTYTFSPIKTTVTPFTINHFNGVIAGRKLPEFGGYMEGALAVERVVGG